MQIDSVLDASAALAVLLDERGADRVRELLPLAGISAVNMSEVLARLIRHGMPEDEALEAFRGLEVPVVPFGAEEAALAAGLGCATAAGGLSLGDRACLATAKALGVRAVTCDTNWHIPRLGITVEFMR